jgi:hypothetical protein
MVIRFHQIKYGALRLQPKLLPEFRIHVLHLHATVALRSACERSSAHSTPFVHCGEPRMQVQLMSMEHREDAPQRVDLKVGVGDWDLINAQHPIRRNAIVQS